MTNTRWALSTTSTVEQIRNYLPSNYQAEGFGSGAVLIWGEDSCGWTLDDYVIPRLASGLHFAAEFNPEDYPGYDYSDPADVTVVASDLNLIYRR